MIVQLIGTKYVQICEAVRAESRTQSTTRIRDGRTDAQTDGYESYVPRSGHAGDNKFVTFFQAVE